MSFKVQTHRERPKEDRNDLTFDTMQAEEKKSSGTASNQSNPADKDLYTTRDGADK